MKTRKSNLTTPSFFAFFVSCFGFSWGQYREEKIYVDIRKEHINYVDYDDYQLANGCMERMIFNSSLDELDKWSKTEIDVSRLEEAYFELNWYDSLTFNSLKRAKKLKVLSISFSFPELYDYHDVGGIRAYPLDLSFLYDLPELECLIIQWNGAYFHPEAISSLKKLKYLKTYATAFHPSILRENKALIQIELENDEHSRVLNRNSIEPFLLDYRLPNCVQFTSENKAYRQFIKQSDDSKFEDWPASICRKNGEGDTLLFWSDIYKPEVSWKSMGETKWMVCEGGFSISSEGETRWSQSKMGLLSLNMKNASDGNLSLVFQQFDDDDHSVLYHFYEKNYLNGVPHGIISNGHYGQFVEELLFDHGILTSKYVSTVTRLPETAGKLTLFPEFGEFDYYRSGAKYHYSGNEVTRMEFFGNAKDDSLKSYLSIYLKDGKYHGNMRAFDKEGKEMYNANYVNGELNGSLFSIYNGNTYKRQYENGKMIGEGVLITERFTERVIMESDTQHYYLIRKLNSNNRTILLYEFNEKTGMYDCTAWGDDGKLWHTSFLDADMKHHGESIYWYKGKMNNRTIWNHGVKISYEDFTIPEIDGPDRTLKP